MRRRLLAGPCRSNGAERCGWWRARRWPRRWPHGLIDKVVCHARRALAGGRRTRPALARTSWSTTAAATCGPTGRPNQLPLALLHWFNPLAWAGWRAMRRDQRRPAMPPCWPGDGATRAAYGSLIAAPAGQGPVDRWPPRWPARMLGEKSIIHRLRSLTMSEPSIHRPLAGRALLAGGRTSLPLTASIGRAQSAPAGPRPPARSSGLLLPRPMPRCPAAPAAPDAPAVPAGARCPALSIYRARRVGEESGDRPARNPWQRWCRPP